MIPSELIFALSVHADAEQAMCEGIDTWHATTGSVHDKARRDLRTRILAARDARGALAQAKRQERLDCLRSGCTDHRIFEKAA